uniref:Uncharacterized protein n=1 Tax=Arundo donax TaxID=35708 RepID=A0A0A9CXG4_ARUDO
MSILPLPNLSDAGIFLIELPPFLVLPFDKLENLWVGLLEELKSFPVKAYPIKSVTLARENFSI